MTSASTTPPGRLEPPVPPVSYPAISHHGAVNGVTGSCHELLVDAGASILIDCGLFQGAETSPDGARDSHLQIDFPIAQVKALVVTHVHIDHVGRIPHLLGAGFTGPVYCSVPSAALLPLVLEDAVKIGFTRDPDLLSRFVRLLRSRIVPIAYGQWTDIDVGGSARLRVRIKPAGHILGSAYVECEIAPAHGPRRRVVFSGDLGAPYSPLLSAPVAPYRADVVVLESTYGDRLHEDRRGRRERLKRIIEHALSDRGVVVIPAFSIGRTQELLYEIEDILHRKGTSPHRSPLDWKSVEIIVDSPLASRFTAAYRELAPYWDKEARARRDAGRHPLSFEQLTTVDTHRQHLAMVKSLRRPEHPCIVIAASGMCAGGRIVNYLRALIGDPRNDILFVGYQARGTPGRDIETYGTKGGYVVLDGERFEIRAKIHSVAGYSAHADQQDLVNFVRRMREPPGEVRIVHGDDEAKQTFKAKLAALGIAARVPVDDSPIAL